LPESATVRIQPRMSISWSPSGVIVSIVLTRRMKPGYELFKRLVAKPLGQAAIPPTSKRPNGPMRSGRIESRKRLVCS
jgi:hypothetical protein